MSLSERIEDYIKKLLQRASTIELQRSELAETFQCVPSQINYVLSTRFTPAQGYIVETRRGGGGFVRIVKLTWSAHPNNDLREFFDNLGMSLNQWEAEGILKRLKDEEIITFREYHILNAIVSRETLQINLPERDIIRARLIQAALTALCRDDI